MLVVSRKKGEEIIVTPGGMELKIVIVSIQGNRCQVGIKAPKDVKIRRGEIQLEDIKKGSSDATPLGSSESQA